jgi:hypothetical protein
VTGFPIHTKEGKTSFLKKRSKKLLLPGSHDPIRGGPRTPTGKSFLVLFFKKEHFFFLI